MRGKLMVELCKKKELSEKNENSKDDQGCSSVSLVKAIVEEILTGTFEFIDVCAAIGDISSDFSDVDPNYVPNYSDDSEDAMQLPATSTSPNFASDLSPELQPQATDPQTPQSANKEKKRSTTLKEKRGRKRIRETSEWIDVKSKNALDSGKEHTNRKGKTIKGRTMGPACKEKCRLKCSLNLTAENRKLVFKYFWDIGNHTRQWDFIVQNVKVRPKKQSIVGESRRSFTREYYFTILNKTHRVCKTTFLNTLGVSEMWITTALKRITEGGTVREDARGRHATRANAIQEATKESVRRHIKLFPVVPSHYTRKNSSKLYLEDGLNMSKMYRLYLEYTETNAITCPASIRQYRDIFNSEFNISFFKPKKDQCEVCSSFSLASDEIQNEMKDMYEKHQRNKEIARSLKEADKAHAIENKKICTGCFDLQKVLPTPISDVNPFYYKSKLATYNFTVYDMGNKEGFCYVWHEQIAKRGPHEIASCLLQFLQVQKDRGVETVCLYSDNCGGQNRNKFVFSMFQYAATLLSLNITHRFLEKGHTQTEGDSMHAVIESAKKRQASIYTPDQWVTLIRMAKASGKPYIVKEMNQDEFFSFKMMTNKQNWLKTEDKQKFKTSQVREITFSPGSTKVLFKYDYEQPEAGTIQIEKLQRGRKTKKCDQTNSLPRLHSGFLPIDPKKLKGLLDLCNNPKKNLIPIIYHQFYHSLKAGENNNNDGTEDSDSDSE